MVLGPLLRSLAPSALAALALSAALLEARPASAASPFLVVPDAAVAEASPAYRYANMTDDEAFAELDRRGIPYARVDADSAPGVRAPIRLSGRLHGVYIHSAVPMEQRATSIFEILDARLGLALDDFTAVLERHDIDELVHYMMYRPNVPRAAPPPAASAPAAAPVVEKVKSDKPAAAPAAAKAAPGKGKAGAKVKTRAGVKSPGAKPARIAAKKAPAAPEKPREGTAKVAAKGAAKAPAPPAPKSPQAAATAKPSAPVAPAKDASRPRWAPPGTRHPAGLAIDVGLLRKKDGTWISVRDHFNGKLGERTCGEGARKPERASAQELRALVCESEAASIFTYVLTPNYNTDHADHFHMEIKPGVRWFLTH